MPSPERTVLHLLPHPGGGGATYVDLLSELPGYRSARVHLAPGPHPRASELARSVARATRMARGSDLVHVHGEAAAGLSLHLLLARPSVVTLHGLHLVRRLGGFRRTAASLNLRALLRAADRTICVSRAEHDELARIVGPTAAARAIVIRNGVRLAAPSVADRSTVRDELGLSQDELVGIWVGSLDERKDPLTAVRAAGRAGITLVVVGDGPLRREVEGAAGERVHVLGQRDDVRRLLSASDFFVLTSRREGLALSLLEAMAHGLTPIVTDLPENVEAVGDTGITVPVGNEGALVRAMARLRDVREAGDLGARTRARAAQLFDADETARRTRALYDEVLGLVRP